MREGGSKGVLERGSDGEREGERVREGGIERERERVMDKEREGESGWLFGGSGGGRLHWTPNRIILISKVLRITRFGVIPLRNFFVQNLNFYSPPPPPV